jgi:hypothetical protein
MTEPQGFAGAGRELEHIAERAATAMDPAVAEWLRTPVPALEGDRLLDRVVQGDAASTCDSWRSSRTTPFTWAPQKAGRRSGDSHSARACAIR